MSKDRNYTDKFVKNIVIVEMKKHGKSKPASDLRSVCLIHDSAGAHKCNLVQDFLEMETMVQLTSPPYSLDLGPCDFLLFTLLKNNLSKLILAVPFFIVYKVYQKKVHLSASRAWILRLETEFLSKEST